MSMPTLIYVYVRTHVYMCLKCHDFTYSALLHTFHYLFFTLYP